MRDTTTTIYPPEYNNTDLINKMSSVFSTSVKPSGQFLKDFEMEIALSQISQGCIPNVVEQKCHLVFKEKKETIVALCDAREISVRFFAVQKDEFPSIGMEIRITTDRDLKLRYDYFFLTESCEELLFLTELEKHGEFSLVFPTESGKALCMSVQLGRKEIESLCEATRLTKPSK